MGKPNKKEPRKRPLLAENAAFKLAVISSEGGETLSGGETILARALLEWLRGQMTVLRLNFTDGRSFMLQPSRALTETDDALSIEVIRP